MQASEVTYNLGTGILNFVGPGGETCVDDIVVTDNSLTAKDATTNDAITWVIDLSVLNHALYIGITQSLLDPFVGTTYSVIVEFTSTLGTTHAFTVSVEFIAPDSITDKNPPVIDPELS